MKERKNVKRLTLTGIALFSMVTVMPVASNADFLSPQTLSASGGTIYITSQYRVPYTGSLVFPKTNLSSPVNFALFGAFGQMAGVGAPPTGTFLYSVMIPPQAVGFATLGMTKLNITVPPTLSTAKSVKLFETQFPVVYGATPSSVTWSSPTTGTRFGNLITFAVPRFTLPAATVMLFELTQ